MQTTTEIEHTLPNTGETYTYHVSLVVCAKQIGVSVEYPVDAVIDNLSATEAYPVAEIEAWISALAGFRVGTEEAFHYGAGRAGHTEEIWCLSACGGAFDLDLLRVTLLAGEAAAHGDFEQVAMCERAIDDEDVESAIECFRAIVEAYNAQDED